MKIKIKVTKEILYQSRFCGAGGEFKGHSCAIALAVIDLFPRADVGHLSIFFDKNQHEPDRITRMPREAINFIRRFDSLSPDRRAAMSELEFDIEVPFKVIEEIGIGEVYRVLSESKTLELVSIQ